jgi:hypothetical protein
MRGRNTVSAMARPTEFRLLASVLAGLLAWSWPGSVRAAPPEPSAEREAGVERPNDEFAPVEIVPVEPEPEPEIEPELEPELDVDSESDIDIDTDEQELEPIVDDYDPLRDSAEARDARRWTRAGIAATVAGTVLVSAATGFGLSSPCNPDIGNNCFRDARDRAALTMGVPGGALLLGGIAMIVVGSMQKRRLRAEFALSRDRIGVAISGRF